MMTDNLFNIADVILTTDNTQSRDRRGGVLGMKILGLRINDQAFIFSYIEVDEDEEGDTLCELEEIPGIENLLDRAKYYHDCYYDGLPAYYEIVNPRQIKNRPAKACKLLDQYYAPEKEFISTPPFVILPIITKKGFYESGRDWAWYIKHFT